MTHPESEWYTPKGNTREERIKNYHKDELAYQRKMLKPYIGKRVVCKMPGYMKNDGKPYFNKSGVLVRLGRNFPYRGRGVVDCGKPVGCHWVHLDFIYPEGE